MGSDPADVLLVEDNPGDARLIERAFEKRSLPGTLHVVRTGDEALDWLHRRDPFADAPGADLVLLDLNLPGTGGLDVLEDVKTDPTLGRIPVVVLTGSRSDADLLEAYEGRANACLVKPVDPEAFADTVELVAEFWLSAAALPPPPDEAATPPGEG